MLTRPVLCVSLVFVTACHSATAPKFSGTCRLWQTANQALENARKTTLIFGDTDCPFTDEQDRLTLPAGTWIIQAQVAWAPNDSGQRGAVLLQNAKTVLAESGARPMLGYVGTLNVLLASVNSDGATFLQVQGTQTSGQVLTTLFGKADRNWVTYLSATRVN